MRKKHILALVLCAAITISLAGCKKGDDTLDPADSQEPGTQISENNPEAPDGFVDNGEGLDGIPDEYLFESDRDAGVTLGKRDESVYYNQEPMSLMFATNLITADPEGDASNGFPLARVWDRVNYIKFADKEYKLLDLIRPRDQGFQVLEMLAADFGVVKYVQDPETGALAGSERLGNISGEELREAYSERSDLEDYTVCVYYLDARMNGMDQADYDECRSILKEAYGTKTDQYLDGTLAVMLYYDTDGYDMYYNIAAIAPSYWDSVDDFRNNMDSNLRHDTTNCHMLIDGEIPVGFVNQVFIRCDKDEVPTGTYIPEEPNSRIEDGGIEDAEKTPGPSVDSDSAGQEGGDE